MATWDELFGRGELVARYAERPVQKFVSLLERRFEERPLRIWDLCCGAGRHTVAIAERGHTVFASDASPNGVALLEERLSLSGLEAEVAIADMTACPWPNETFHGAISWDALHHNVVSGTRAAVGTVRERLVPGGWLLATLKSARADSFGMGTEIEPGTFVKAAGDESGVPHHFYTESEVRELFAEWDLCVLVERVCCYQERPTDFFDVNPFDYTVWGVLARRPARSRPGGA